MKVNLIEFTPNPERVVAAAAKLCYSPSSIEETTANITPESAGSFVKMLAKMGHESPLEHVSFTFGIEGVSRSLLAQITRHRIASYSVQSQRYVKNFNCEYIIPPEIEKNSEAKKEFISFMIDAQSKYEKLADLLKNQHVKNLKEEGKLNEAEVDKVAEKMAIEDARYVLPNAYATKIICTFNARSLLNFFNHRCCNRAQWEIRQLACEMLKLVKKVAPNIFAFAGPSCVCGFCKEGRMSCGNSKKVKEFFEKI